MKQSLTTDNIISILKDLGATVQKETSSEIIFSSICCHLDADCHKKKLYWYKSSNTFFCFKCDFSGDIFSLVAQRWKLQGKQYTFPEVINYVMSICGFENTKFERKQKADIYDWQSDLSKYLHIETQQNVMKIYDKSVLNFFEDIYHQSWIDEGISIETLMKYNIKYYPLANQIVIPVYDIDGNLIGLHARNLNPEMIDAGFKYMPVKLLDGTEYKFATSCALYGIDKNAEHIVRKKEAIIVEAPKSVLQAENILDTNNTVAIFGMNMSKRNKELLLLLGINKIVIALDRQYKEMYTDNKKKVFTDEFIIYQKKINKIIDMFRGFVEINVIYDDGHLLNYKDSPFDNDKNIWKELYAGRFVTE